MAGNRNSGRKPKFPLSEAKLKDVIADYKAQTEAGTIVRASWPHFAAIIGLSEKRLKIFIETYLDDEESIYYGRAQLLEGVLTWMRGQIFSTEGWNGQMSTRAIALLDQDFGDGVSYKNKGGDNVSEVQVLFGGGDERAKDAAK